MAKFQVILERTNTITKQAEIVKVRIAEVADA
jgi:hypothetical protein